MRAGQYDDAPDSHAAPPTPFTDQDPRLGGVDVDTWRAVPAEGNPDGKRTRGWNIVAGDYPDEPDVWITVEAEFPKDVAEFIVAAVRTAVARHQTGRTMLSAGTRDGDIVTLTGAVTCLERHITKQGNPWVTFNLVDGDSTMRVTVPPLRYSRYEELLAAPPPRLVITGRVDLGESVPSLVATEISEVTVAEIYAALSFAVPFEVDSRLISHLVDQHPRVRAEAAEYGWLDGKVRSDLLHCLADELLGRPFHRYEFHKIGIAADQENRDAFFADLRRAHDEWVRRG